MNLLKEKVVNYYVCDPTVLLQAEFSMLSQAINTSLRTRHLKSKGNEYSRQQLLHFAS